MQILLTLIGGRPFEERVDGNTAFFPPAARVRHLGWRNQLILFKVPKNQSYLTSLGLMELRGPLARNGNLLGRGESGSKRRMSLSKGKLCCKRIVFFDGCRCGQRFVSRGVHFVFAQRRASRASLTSSDSPASFQLLRLIASVQERNGPQTTPNPKSLYLNAEHKIYILKREREITGETATLRGLCGIGTGIGTRLLTI